jgi:hypothetical protein
MKPRVACLMPTYGRPKMVMNSIACFDAQDYPVDRRALFILDDIGQYKTSYNDGWLTMSDVDPPLQMCDGPYHGRTICLYSTSKRYPSLPAKYKFLMDRVGANKYDIVMVWDDDDVYLPHYISSHVAALEQKMWSHPKYVLAEVGPQALDLEGARGRFHGSLAARTEAIKLVGGWEGVMEGLNVKRADFDQRMIGALQKQFGDPGHPEPVHQPGYIFRWGSTGHGHCQALMKSPDNTDWYDRYQPTDRNLVEKIVPEFDAVTRKYYASKALQVA